MGSRSLPLQSSSVFLALCCPRLVFQSWGTGVPSLPQSCLLCLSLDSPWPQHPIPPLCSFSSHPAGLWGPPSALPPPRSQTLHLHLPAIASVYPTWHSLLGISTPPTHLSLPLWAPQHLKFASSPCSFPGCARSILAQPLLIRLPCKQPFPEEEQATHGAQAQETLFFPLQTHTQSLVSARVPPYSST